MDNSEDDTAESSSQPNGFQIEVVKSYLAFGRRALRRHWKAASAVFLTGLGLTYAVNAYLPRTYTCTTVLVALVNPVLEGMGGGSNPLAGASDLVLRHDNLENMIRDTHLAAKVEARRPPILALKDHLSAMVFGQPSNEAKAAALVGTVGSKIQVFDSGFELTINADWSDGQTAADLAQSAYESFMNIRHAAEVSVFEEKLTILDQHAGKVREEVEQLAQQINSQNERATATQPATSPQAPRPVSTQVRAAASVRPAEPDAVLPELRLQLEDGKKKLTALEADHDRQVREEQAKLAELRLRFTAAHPQVVTQQERIALVSQTPADILSLRAELDRLASEIKSRDATAAHLSGEGGSRFVIGNAGGPAETLPAAVVQALQKQDTDQAMAQQLATAVGRYGVLRDEISSDRVALDTAQAAFNHRYQIIVPVEPPAKPKKPKASVILGGGFAASLLLALLLPLAAELRRGVLMERWQVQQLQLPILAELNLPPRSE